MFSSHCPPVEAAAIQPRPYQREALEALNEYLRTKDGNPAVVLPTGAGKSLVIAWAVQGWKHDHPPFRCMILAHRKELVEQNAAELEQLWPGGDIGIYSASQGRRDVDASVTYAMIDSVAKRAGEFPPFDMILVDEAHRIPPKGEGKYRSFIAECKKANPNLRVAGFTATPFRLGSGPICHPDHILHEVCYEAHISDLIRDGYLCRLRSKVGHDLPDLSSVRRNGRGDYVGKSLAEAVDVPSVVSSAVREAVMAIRAEGRRSAVFFCVDHAHCKAVSLELRRHGIEAPMVTSKTKAAERDRIVERFKAGHYRAICNINVYTEGFNAKRVDCVVLLRPTLSKGLYAQMVGRGLRLHPDKEDCLVLDFARTIETHGPIDCLEAGEVRVIECGSIATKCRFCEGENPELLCDACAGTGVDSEVTGCGDTFSRALGRCPNCGWKIPPHEVARAAAEAAERKLHEAKAAEVEILGREPQEVPVHAVTVHRHRKLGSPDTVRVQYRCGLQTFREWLAFDHPVGSFPHRKAQRWWTRRFGSPHGVTVDSVTSDLFVASQIKAMTEALTVVRRGKHWEILSHKLRRTSGDS